MSKSTPRLRAVPLESGVVLKKLLVRAFVVVLFNKEK